MGATMQVNLKDAGGRLRGRIAVFSRSPDGSLHEVLRRDNIITYQSADMLAGLLANDQRYRPAHIGYLYGPAATGSPMPNPSATRDHDMTLLAAELLAVPGNMIVSPLGANPLITVDGDPLLYEGNAITLSAISDATSALIYPPVSGYEATAPQPGVDNYYQVALLSKYYEPGSVAPVFKLFARTQLAAGTGGLLVQAGSELVVFWTISFT